MDVLKALMPRTNITEYVQDFLHDSQVQMRLRACGALIDHAEKKDSTAISGVPACLAGILATAGDLGTLTIASQYAANLSSAASNCIPELMKLRKPSSKEARSAAAESLKRIETQSP
jgi:hypothetical protein